MDKWEALKQWINQEKRRSVDNDFDTVKFSVDGGFSVRWRPICEAVLEKMNKLEET